MDIHSYLNEWHAIEPNRCVFIEGDKWKFDFEGLSEKPANYPLTLTCDVISVHGVGVIEDLIKACVSARTDWTYMLDFDREEELFLGQVTDAGGDKYIGLDSLNPGIALLTAYLNTLKNQRPI